MLSCRKSSCASFASWKRLLFPIGSHRGTSCCWSKNLEDFWKWSVIPRQTLPSVIKATRGAVSRHPPPTPPATSPPATPHPHPAHRLLPCVQAMSFNWYCCARIWKGPGNGYVCSSLLELACVYVRIRVPQLTCERALLNWLRRKHSRIQSTGKGPARRFVQVHVI